MRDILTADEVAKLSGLKGNSIRTAIRQASSRPAGLSSTSGQSPVVLCHQEGGLRCLAQERRQKEEATKEGVKSEVSTPRKVTLLYKENHPVYVTYL